MKLIPTCALLASVIAGAPTAVAVDLAACTAVTHDGAGQFAVFSNASKPTKLWAYRTTSQVESVSLAQDGTQLLFPTSDSGHQYINVATKLTSTRTRIAGSRLDDGELNARWLTNQDILIKKAWRARTIFNLATATSKGVSLSPQEATAQYCERNGSQKQLVCSGDWTLQVDEQPVAGFEHYMPEVQARVAIKSMRLQLGKPAAIAGGGDSVLVLKEVETKEVTIRVQGANGIWIELSLAEGEHVRVDFSEPVHLMRLVAVEADAVQLELLELPGEPYDFGPIASLAWGTVLVGITGPEDGAYLELWQKRGDDFRREQRLKLPRHAALTSLRAEAPGVLLVQDEQGFYALSYALTRDTSGAATGVYFASPQMLPASLAGQPVADWRCQR